ncbi:MAG: hypothetical protein JKY60_15030 [Kordiimonadaceae bacterium]|nr:hypothetical protein [Kordiimonadaceae bacterium]
MTQLISGNNAASCGCTNSCSVPIPKPVIDDDICSLPPTDKQSRLDFFRRDLLPHVKQTETLPDGRAWIFNFSDDLSQKLDDLVIFERQCCSGVTWEIDRDVNAKTIRLSLTGIDPHSKFFDQLGDKGSHSEAPSTIRTLVKSSAAGVMATLGICCIVPLAISLFAGAATAAPLYALVDNGPVISGTAVLASLLAWLYLTRKR